MTQILKQSTAVDVLIGPFVDLNDGSTSEDGESPVVEISKNGQALAAKNDSTTPANDDLGYYNCEFDATDTNTVGTLILAVEATATALPVRHEFQVVEEAIYDAIYGASATGFDANGRVDVGEWLGTAAATPTTAGVPEVDVTFWLGTACSTPTTAGLPEVDVLHIGASAAAVTSLALSAAAIIIGAVQTSANATTTTTLESDTTAVIKTAADHWNGRILIFTSGTLIGQSTDITDAEKNGSFEKLTFSAITEAPANGGTFIIV